MKKLLLGMVAFLLVALPAVAQEQLGRIEGRVTTEEGAAVAGATVELSSPNLVAGKLTATTDERGRFRFQLLPVGTYSIKVTAEQYQTFEQSGIQMRIGATVTLNPVLKIGAFEQVITIAGEAPLIDVKSTGVGETFTQDIISKLPTGRFPTEMINLAAGNVDGDSGGSTLGGANRTNAYKMDGIDVSDPATGTIWVFVNPESIEEMEIVPIAGATADVGNFTGAALNMVTKSGGNEFTGGFAIYYFDESFITWNTDDEDLRDTISRYARNKDGTGFFGGPVIKDKLWFFVNVGMRNESWERRKLFDTWRYRNTMWKVSSVLREDMNLYGTFHYDNYLSNARGSGYNVSVEATGDQEGPNKSFAVDYAWVIDDNNLFEAKFHGWTGYFALHAKDISQGPMIYDYDNNWYYNGYGGDYRSDRNRYEVNADFTRYMTEMAGDHELRLGLGWQRGQHETWETWDYMEIYRGNWDYRETYDPFDYVRNRTIGWTFYATDAWNLSDRLLINVGFRFDRPSYIIPEQELINGEVLPAAGTVHTMSNLAPRIGFTYKLTEDGTTLLRGSWGRYYEGMFTYMLDEYTPSIGYYNQYYWDDEWIMYRSTPLGADQTMYTLDDDLGGLYTDAFTLGVEKEMFRDIVFGADFIHREYKNYPVFIEDGMTWTPIQASYEGTTYTLYSMGAQEDEHYTITNAGDELYSRYDGLILRATKRYANNWQLQASLTLSRLKGTAESASGSSTGSINAGIDYYEDPNNQINADGLQIDHRPWNLKFNATYTFPYDISVSTITAYEAGRRWSPRVRIYDDRLEQRRVTILAEPRGSRTMDSILYMDLRIEKVFRFSKFRTSFLFDVYNLFNLGTTYRIVDRLDYSDFEEPTSLITPRYFQLGWRLAF